MVGECVGSKEPSNLSKDTFAHPTIKVSAYKATNKLGNLNRAGWGWAAVDSEMKGKHKTTGLLFLGLWTQDKALVFSGFLFPHQKSAVSISQGNFWQNIMRRTSLVIVEGACLVDTTESGACG